MACGAAAAAQACVYAYGRVCVLAGRQAGAACWLEVSQHGGEGRTQSTSSINSINKSQSTNSVNQTHAPWCTWWTPCQSLSGRGGRDPRCVRQTAPAQRRGGGANTGAFRCGVDPGIVGAAGLSLGLAPRRSSALPCRLPRLWRRPFAARVAPAAHHNVPVRQAHAVEHVLEVLRQGNRGVGVAPSAGCNKQGWSRGLRAGRQRFRQAGRKGGARMRSHRTSPIDPPACPPPSRSSSPRLVRRRGCTCAGLGEASGNGAAAAGRRPSGVQCSSLSASLRPRRRGMKGPPAVCRGVARGEGQCRCSHRMEVEATGRLQGEGVRW